MATVTVLERQLAEARLARDARILQAREAGFTLQQIATLEDLTRSRVSKIVKKFRPALDLPSSLL